MKQKNIFKFRTLLLVLAMITGGAGSAAAQTESDYFRLTKYPGTPDESISYYETFDGALVAAADGDLITLLKDYTATGRVDINISITLDLNDHTISGAVEGDLIFVKSDATLTLTDNGTDTQDKGAVVRDNDEDHAAISVASDGTLTATGVSIDGGGGAAIYVQGTADIDGCILTGNTGISNNGETTVANTVISGCEVGISVVSYYMTIDGGVSISGCTKAGIIYNDGVLIPNAWPTFGSGGDANGVDFLMYENSIPFFGGDNISAPQKAMTLRIVSSNEEDIKFSLVSNTITSEYDYYFTDDDGVIDPNRVFRWYDDNAGYGFGLNGEGEVYIGKGCASITVVNEGNKYQTKFYTYIAYAIEDWLESKISGEVNTNIKYSKLNLYSDYPGENKAIYINPVQNCKAFGLGLNGHTFGSEYDRPINVGEGASFIVEDSGWGGRLCVYGDPGIENNGILKLKGGTISSGNTCISNNGALTVSDVTFDRRSTTFDIDSATDITFNGLPTFNYSTDNIVCNINLAEDCKINFGPGTYVAPERPISVHVTNIPPYTFTSGYARYVRDAAGHVIPPGSVFAQPHDGSKSSIVYDMKAGEAAAYSESEEVTLEDGGENSGKFVSGKRANVTLAGRTLAKDGTWNTLCLPFAVRDRDADDGISFTGTPLQGAIVKELDPDDRYNAAGEPDENGAYWTGFNTTTGKLTLCFRQVDAIEAGKPYIVKWDADDDPVTSPRFEGVTITTDEASPVLFDDCYFVGQFCDFFIDNTAYGYYDDGGHIDEILFFASDPASKKTLLGYSQSPRDLRPFRAHFWVPASDHDYSNGSRAVSSVLLNLGEDSDATGVVELKNSRIEELNSDDGWYTMDGRRLPGKPVRKGVYVHGGRKIVVK